MMKTTIHRLNEFGQSVWLDNISRSMIERGRLKELIGLGLRGMTSNPTIFDKSIRTSVDYDPKIEELHNSGMSVFEIYDELTVKDVQDAADIFMPVYNATQGSDGYVSLEVNPKLAFNVNETIRETRRLIKKVSRPNVMFKIPSTDAGFGIIEELTAEGVNINATLIFSLSQYTEVARAYMAGLKRLSRKRRTLETVRSVASVFVSRIDTAVDRMIEEKALPEDLKGKAAVSNCNRIYREYLRLFSGGDFISLKERGANAQRVLWASTSTKNPGYSDIKYITELIARDTVNTLPEDTFRSFLDHGVVKDTVDSNSVDADDVIRRLSSAGIDIDTVCEALLRDGIMAFEKSFDSLLSSIEAKTEAIKTAK